MLGLLNFDLLELFLLIGILTGGGPYVVRNVYDFTVFVSF